MALVRSVARLAGIMILSSATLAAGQPGVQRYVGMCDASAVVSLEGNRFVVANDEDNRLRVYRIGQSLPETNSLDLSAFLGAGSDEADIEGAAVVGSRIYWITSHGANKNGKARPVRRRFFATDIVSTAGILNLVPVGQPYLKLVDDLVALDKTANHYDFPARAQRAPEAGGLNIEGLVTKFDGSLLLALRSPVVGGEAALIPITNPADMIVGKAARLGAALSLGLEGLGVRSIEALPDGKGYVVAAGPVANGPFEIFFWDGVSKMGNPLKIDLAGMSPEAIAIERGSTDRLLLLSDDGDELIDGVSCKTASPSKRSFRGFELTLPKP